MLGVALVEVHLKAFGAGTLACLHEEIGSDVDAGDDGALAGERDGGIAGAAGDVEDAGPGWDGEAAAEGFGAA